MNSEYSDIKIPPYSIEAEQSVIGGLLVNNAAWEEVEPLLSPSDFYREDHRLIFQAIAGLAVEKQPFDIITVSDKLTANQQLEQVGGVAYIANIIKETPSAANIAAYVALVREKAHLRQLIEITTDIQTQAYASGRGDSASSLIARFESQVFQLAERTSNAKAEVTPIKPALKDLLLHMEAVSKMDEQSLLGATSGLSDLDEATDGLQRGDLVIVAARPSMGKSTLSADFERSISKTDAVLAFSLEMPVRQLIMRHVSAMSGVPLNRVKKAMRLTEDEWALLANGAIKPLSDCPLFYVDKPGISVSEVVAYARRVHREQQNKTGKGLRLITIDYVQLMSTDSSGNRAEDLGNISRRLKQLALELDCTVVLLSQLNRNLEQRPNKRPVMSDLRESGALEQDADMIIFIYRDEVYNAESPDKGTAELIIGKNRNGALGTIRVTAQLDRVRFANFAPEQYAGGL